MSLTNNNIIMYYLNSNVTPPVIEDDYGYFCDPSTDDNNNNFPTTNLQKNITKKRSITKINSINSKPDMSAFNEKYEGYKNVLIYSTIIVGTFVITNLLVAYNII